MREGELPFQLQQVGPQHDFADAGFTARMNPLKNFPSI